MLLNFFTSVFFCELVIYFSPVIWQNKQVRSLPTQQALIGDIPTRRELSTLRPNLKAQLHWYNDFSNSANLPYQFYRTRMSDIGNFGRKLSEKTYDYRKVNNRETCKLKNFRWNIRSTKNKDG